MARERREVWAKRVERWLDSGLTANEFATETGVNARTLAYWKWRLGTSVGHGKRRSVVRPSTFLEVVGMPVTGDMAPAPGMARSTSAADAEAAAEPLELVLRSGHRIRVPIRFDPAAVRRLVDALEVR